MSYQKVRINSLRRTASWLIYGSILLGILLIVQLYSLAPFWLFYSILAGWVAYLIVGIGVALHVRQAYLSSLALAFLTLTVSLPQPQHYSFGLSYATLTFSAGSILQVGVIVSVARYLLAQRR